MHRYVGASGIVVLLVLGHFSTSVRSDTPATSGRPVAAVPVGIRQASGQLKNGLSSGFETNLGQADARYDFLARRAQMLVYLDGGDVTLGLREGEDVVTMKLSGRNRRTRVRSMDRLPTIVNYYRGPRGRGWHSNIPTYARVEYSGVYRGVDLAYYFDSRGRLEHDFIVAPGGNPASIRLRIDGARRIHLDAAGDLQLQTTRGGVTLRKPALYQMVGTDRQKVEGRYVRRGAREIGFEVGAYDRTRPLWIDPVVYATYLGGSTNDEGRDIAVDPEGNAYVTGFTMSANLPVLNASQPNINGWQDAFVAKFDGAGTLQYCTYLGGSSMDTGQAIAVGSGGVVHVTGRTHRSQWVPTDFPTTPGAFQPEGRYWDAFVARFDATGALVASTLFGGTGDDEGAGIAVDAQGNSYNVGTSGNGVFKSTDGGAAWVAAGSGLTGAAKDVTTLLVDPISPNTVYAGTYGAGVFKSVDGAASWSASNAGVGSTRVTQIAINPGMPATMHAGLTNLQGDAYVAVLTGDGTLSGSVRVGGDGSDYGAGVAAMSSGSVYLTGTTYARDYPTTPGAAQPQFGGALDAFVTRLACVSPITLTSIGVDPGLLWPPDHRRVPVSLDYQVRGACGVVTCSLSVASNEPVDGTGDGNAEPDWAVIDARHATLRAERRGLGAGRTYTLTVTCSDAAGRQATGNTVVTVPISYR